MARVARPTGLRCGLAALAAGFVLLLAFAPPSRAADGAPAHAAGAPARAAASAQARNRRIVFAKAASGYRWKLTSGPVPSIGPRQVLVHVRAVSINHDDLSELAPNPRGHLDGLTAGFDAAGIVVAVGRDVTQVRVGTRVTDSYFPQWVEGPPSARELAATTRGVFADYIALDASAIVPVPKELTSELLT
ncbi:MAG: alcohol dehydrogenase catalytic domain-containing protein [Steroidobacteraceae bacterium]